MSNVDYSSEKPRLSPFHPRQEERNIHSAWSVWKHEVVWISAYFTFGVWLSIAMVFVPF